MKRHTLGITLCSIYIFATAACWMIAFTSGIDPKGAFVLKQLPLALQIAFIDWLGFDLAKFAELSWVSAYAILFPLTLVLLFCTGWLVTRLISWLWLISKWRVA